MEKVNLLFKYYDLLILFLYAVGYVLELQTKYLCWNEEEVFTGRQMKSSFEIITKIHSNSMML